MEDVMKNSERKIIVTHTGKMHLDELTAIALEWIYSGSKPIVVRIKHAESISDVYKELESLGIENFHAVIDTGCVYDGVTYFDHHQFKETDLAYGKSSAGLVYDVVRDEIFGTSGVVLENKLDRFIKIVDRDDIGEEPLSEPSDLRALVNAYNYMGEHSSIEYSYILNPERRIDNPFMKCLEIIKDHIEYLINISLESQTIYTKIMSGDVLFNSVIDIGKRDGLGSWSDVIYGDILDNKYEAIIWENDDGSYGGKVINKNPNTYDRVGRGFVQDTSMKFVHESGFYCVAPNKDTMLKYIEKIFK
jgi:hypothetical protein